MSIPNEVYQHGHHASVVTNHAKRTAEVEAAFFLPYLKPGMHLLDVGCGPGSITTGLALRVAPAQTIGIDPSEDVIEMARLRAKAQLTNNVTFETGNIYEHRFTPESFDAVFAHQVLQHLSRPIDALRQFRSLLKPGGVVGARDVDWGSTTFYPENRGMRHFLALYDQLARLNGGEANAGRFLPHWFHEAGFFEIRVTTSTGVIYRSGRDTRMGRHVCQPHIAIQYCCQISGVRYFESRRSGYYCGWLAHLGSPSGRVFLFLSHGSGRMEELAIGSFCLR
ncbi:methyltransferase domain-containing protein (plasmid) [Bradyrhizobium sp. CB82]|uniref:methyltransferase domain-containing protein n=1 Tax=Bradyrhizobium sp. CB82 TaxID=3039159 RepID=UPI0024B28383|nr:methyltransferase domain-containing protein [Bradyrhizobium sp. CB82]WFU45867.1 methyltransferase domain-containing protein [Bradyrhizobium sp. CB82]